MNKLVRRLETFTEARAFALFLAKERKRHLDDVKKIDEDLWKMRDKWGVEVPKDADLDTWIEP